MKPIGNKIQLDIKAIKAGAVQTEAIEEHGTIVATGERVKDWDVENEEWVESDVFKIGATLYFKAWAVDIISEGDEKYYFISADSDAICGIKYE